MQGRLSDDDVQALAVRAREGHQNAFEQLYHYFRPTIWRLCVSRLNGNVEEAQDVEQNAFLKAHRGMESYRGDTAGEFVEWLRNIAKNACIDWIKRNSGWQRRVRLLAARVGTPFDWAQERMRRQAPWRCIWRVLGEFAPEKREAFILRTRGVKVDDIARILKRPAGTVKTWLHDKKTGVLAILKARCGGGERGTND